MSTNISLYHPPSQIKSALFRNPTDAIPPTDELEQLQHELKLLKQKSLERARKAGEDLKSIEESMRRMKEREKGKAKVVDKIKRERGCESCSFLCCFLA
jgi:transcriptional adapter 3